MRGYYWREGKPDWAIRRSGEWYRLVKDPMLWFDSDTPVVLNYDSGDTTIYVEELKAAQYKTTQALALGKGMHVELGTEQNWRKERWALTLRNAGIRPCILVSARRTNMPASSERGIRKGLEAIVHFIQTPVVYEDED